MSLNGNFLKFSLENGEFPLSLLILVLFDLKNRKITNMRQIIEKIS